MAVTAGLSSSPGTTTYFREGESVLLILEMAILLTKWQIRLAQGLLEVTRETHLRLLLLLHKPGAQVKAKPKNMQERRRLHAAS